MMGRVSLNISRSDSPRLGGTCDTPLFNLPVAVLANSLETILEQIKQLVSSSQESCFLVSSSQESCFNPSLQRLFLDHDIVFYFLDNIEKISVTF